MLADEKLPPTIREQCGRARGVRLHYNNGETLCLECTAYKRASWKSWYKNNSATEKARFKQNMLDPTYKARRKSLNTAQQRRRRARMREQGYEIYHDSEVLEIYGTDCHLCEEPIDFDAPRSASVGSGWERGLHIDHIIPVSKGGEDTLENVRPAHALCNLQKHAKHDG